MKLYPALFLSLFIVTSFSGESDFDKALEKAKAEHKLVLLRFTGSDWCVPCIRMNKEIFEKTSFSDYAENHLVIVEADFPRLKKNRLPEEKQKANDELAEKYDAEGIFPMVLLLNEKGNVLKTWEGYADMSSDQFISQLKQFVDDRH